MITRFLGGFFTAMSAHLITSERPYNGLGGVNDSFTSCMGIYLVDRC